MPDLKQLENSLKAGRLSRHDCIKATSLIGFTAAAPSILSGTAYAAGPIKGGHLKVAMDYGSTTGSLDPTDYGNAFFQMLGSTIHNLLAVVNPDGSLAATNP